MEDPLEKESRGTSTRRRHKPSSRTKVKTPKSKTTRAKEKNEAACAEFFGSNHSHDKQSSSSAVTEAAPTPRTAVFTRLATAVVSPPTKSKPIFVAPVRSTDLAAATPPQSRDITVSGLYVAPTRRKDISVAPPPTRARAVPSKRALPKVTRSALTRRSFVSNNNDSDDMDDCMSVRTSASVKSVTFRGPDDGLEQIRTYPKQAKETKSSLFYTAKEIAQMQEDSLKDSHEKLQQEKDRIIDQRKAEKAAKRKERQQRLQARRAARHDSSTAIPSSQALVDENGMETTTPEEPAKDTTKVSSKRRSREKSKKDKKKKDKKDKRSLMLLQHGSLNALDLHDGNKDTSSHDKSDENPAETTTKTTTTADRPTLISLKRESWHASMSILQDTPTSTTPSKKASKKSGKLSSSKQQQQQERLIYVPTTTSTASPSPSTTPKQPSRTIVIDSMEEGDASAVPMTPTPTTWTPPLPLESATSIDSNSNNENRDRNNQDDSPSPDIHMDHALVTPTSGASTTATAKNRVINMEHSPIHKYLNNHPGKEEEKKSPIEYQPTRPTLQSKSLSFHSVTLHQHKRRNIEDDNSKSNRGFRLVGSSSCRDLLMNECSNVSHHSLGKRGSRRGGDGGTSGFDLWSKLFGATTTA